MTDEHAAPDDDAAPGAELLSRRVGEVVESASDGFTAQCYRVEAAPPLGALVRTAVTPGGPTLDIYGVVSRVVTEPLDAARPVLARGELAASEAEVLRDHPQLERLLTSRFQAIIVGFSDGTAARQFLPPAPPRVHSFIYQCSPAETAAFTVGLDLLRLLLHSGAGAGDEVTAAFLRQAAAARPDAAAFAAQAGRALAMELAADAARLSAILRRVVW